MRLQTCRRHPGAGPFARTCPGCAQELHDTETRNRAEAQARTALALVGTPDAEILTVHATPTTLIVATHQPGLAFEHAVDVFRLPTPAETDPELADDYRLPAGQWILDWQAGDHTPDATPRMIADAREHLARTGLPVPPLPRTLARTVVAPVVLVELPTRPVLPATKAAADRDATDSLNAFWDHTVDCEACLNAEDSTRTGQHCRTGSLLARRMDDAATVAADFARLDHWHRRGGREQANTADYIAT